MIKNGKNLVEEQNNQANNYVKNLIGEKKNLIIEKKEMAAKYEAQISESKKEKKEMVAKYKAKISELEKEKVKISEVFKHKIKFLKKCINGMAIKED